MLVALIVAMSFGQVLQHHLLKLFYLVLCSKVLVRVEHLLFLQLNYFEVLVAHNNRIKVLEETNHFIELLHCHCLSLSFIHPSAIFFFHPLGEAIA